MQAESKPSSTALLRLRVSTTAESTLRSGHPWVFSNSIREKNRAGTTGDLVAIYDRKDRFLALGLWDSDSPIRVRILHAGKPQTIDTAWWAGRLNFAVGRRENLFDDQTNGFRYINGESDGWPGLVLDRYDSTLVLKLYTAAWLPRLSQLADLIWQRLKPKRVVVRLSRNVQKRTGASLGLEAQVIRGEPVTHPIIFLESGIRFEADVLRGQKTGFFLDQRENRRIVRSLAGGRAVLNTFSFTGAFSVYAACGGARSVMDVDISSHATAAAQRNFKLNSTTANFCACLHESIQADAFEWLASSNRKFGLVILDPPSLAKRESERAGAVRAYARLAELGLRRLSPGGLLVACSCSAHVKASEFFETVRNAARSRVDVTELKTTLHPPDHPAEIPEAHYLKTIYMRRDS